MERCKRSYEHGVTDEFIEPVTIVDERNEPVGLIRDEDACIFFNYPRRPRPRDDAGAHRSDAGEALARFAARELDYTTMTQYDKILPVPFVLPPEHRRQHPGRT